MHPQSAIRNPQWSEGFTLVEVLMVALLFLIIGGGLLTTFLSGQASYLSADAYIQVQQEARRAFDRMVRELRQAGPSTGGAATVMTVAPNANQLNFQIPLGYNLPAPCPADAICWGAENQQVGSWVHYAVIINGTLPAPNNQQLVRCVTGPGTRNNAVPANGVGCQVLANDVANGVPNPFVLNLPNAVTLTLQIQYQNNALPGGSQGIGTGPGGALTTTIRLRNS